MSEIEEHEARQRLRQRAQEQLAALESKSAAGLEPEVLRLVQELQLHQVELEIQNEELRRVSLQLEDTQRQFFTLFNLAPIGYLALDELGLITRANATFCQMIGKAPNRVLGRPLNEFILVEDRDVFLARYKAFFKNPGNKILETRLPGKNQRLLTVQMRGALIEAPGSAESGQAASQLLLTIADITEQKEAELAVRQSELRFRQLAETIREVFWLRDAATRQIIYVSPQYERIWGQNPAELYLNPQLFSSTIHPDDKAEVLRRQQRMYEHGEPFNYTYRIIRPDGELRWVYARAYPVVDEYGQASRFAGIGEDVTDQKLAEREREQMLVELARKNEELERFTYTVSHDLKSPLITIQGFVEYLAQDLQDKDLVQAEIDLKRIGAAADKMKTLLDNLLELSRIGQIANPPVEVNLGDLAGEAVELLSGSLRQVRVQIAPDLPVVLVDRARLVEVYQNLLENAVKYMGSQPHPMVEVGWRVVADESHYFVRDNGIGIEPRHQDKIFGLFEQLDPRAAGNGVGLALVRRIVEVHGGRVWVESQGKEQGSTFFFTLSPAGPQSYNSFT